MKLEACLLIVLCVACSAAPESAVDGARDLDASTSDVDAHATSDADLVRDADLVDAAASDASDLDAATRDAAVVDAAADEDASSVDLGRVACRDDAECGPDQTCDRDAPGGRCQSCTGSCVSSDYECLFGACLATCGSDVDCNAGMRCAAFSGSSYCRPRDCGGCPAPYVCRDTECSRPLCDAGGSCPAPLVCESGICVEP